MALGRLRDELQAVVVGFEAGVLTAAEALTAVELFAEVKRLAEVGEALAAKRVDETSAWRAAGARSVGHFLAGRTGESPSQVGRMVDTARKLDRLGDTADAVRTGQVSIEQAAAIAGAAAIDPGCERDLLDTARSSDLGSLKKAAARARAAGDRHDEQRHARQRAAREFRMWVDDDGMGNARWRTTPEEYAELQAIHERFRDEAFEAARTAGRRDPERHLASDGFARLLRAAAGCGEQRDGSPAKKDVRLFVLVSDTALLRGRTEPGETCEIVGTGPVPVSVAKQVCGPNPFVSIIETDGTDVHRVVRAGRRIAPEIRDALFVRDRGCVVPGCTTTRRLEVHHVVPYAESRQTRLDELATVCAHHHDRISHDGAVLAGGPGQWHWRPPPRPDDDARAGP